MKKNIFKVGDVVFRLPYGRGKVEFVTDDWLEADFKGALVRFRNDDELLSFTEYTIKGFSKERPVDFELGELVAVRNSVFDRYYIAKYIQKLDCGWFYCQDIHGTFNHTLKWKHVIKLTDLK